MPTTQLDISRWFDTGVEKGATHMAVFVDTFDHDDYPVYITADSVYEARDKVQKSRGKMQRLMEVYHLGSDKNTQLNERRAHHYEKI